MPTVTDSLTAVLVIITGFYCYFTYRILEKNSEIVAAMKAQHESFIAPAINVAIQIKHIIFFCLKIKNTGRSAAKNLRLTLDRDFFQYGEEGEEKNLRNFPTFQQPIPSFSPEEEIFFMFARGPDIDKEEGGKVLSPSRFTITVQYEFAGRPFTQEHEIDLGAYMRGGQDRDELLQEVEKIRKALEKMGS